MRITGWGKKQSKMADAASSSVSLLRVSGKSPDYISTLAPEDKKRYKEKLQVPVRNKFEAFKSPYDVWDDNKVWSNSPSTWPDVSYGDLYSYLIESPGPFSKEKLKVYKSLEAYDYFVSRKVGPVSSFKGEPSPPGFVLLRAEVRPGQAESAKESHLAWVICKTSGEIIVGHCDCKAGLGETCSHVAALLFKVEVGVRVGLTKTSCTSEACRWNQVFGNNSLTAPVVEINFKPSKRIETTPREPCEKDSNGPLACTRGDEGYVSAYAGFLKELHSICPTAAVFKSLPRLDEEETDTANSQTDYSEVDTTGHTTDEELEGGYEVNVVNRGDAGSHPTIPTGPPNFPVIGAVLEKYTTVPIGLPQKLLSSVQNLALSYDDARQLCSETEKQAECPKWFEAKYQRLTSSNFGKIVKKMESRRAKPELVVRDLLNPRPPTSYVNRFLEWGRKNEEVAVQVYKGLDQKRHCVLYNNGIYVSPEDCFLAATPDRIVYDCKASHPWGLHVVEVKCPYSAKDKTPLEAAKTLKNFMLKEVDGELSLDRSHDYHYQVQGQMALTGAKWCDFVVYTKCGIAVERVEWDSEFWNSAVKKLSTFFFNYFLPEYVNTQENK